MKNMYSEMIRRIRGDRFQEKPSNSSLIPIWGVLFALSIALNIYFFFSGEDEKEAPVPATESVLQTQEKTVAPREESVPTAPPPAAVKKTPASPAGKGQFQVVDFPVLGPKEVRHLSFTVNSSITQTLCGALSKEEGCEILTAYLTRLLIWKVNTNADLRNGDAIRLLIEPGAIEEKNNILATHFHGSKVGDLAVFFYKAPDWKYGSYFYADGSEIHPRFPEAEAPIRDFSELTSWVGDFRAHRGGHSGLDFKTEAGTPVYSPFAGQVTRVNWNFRANGNCIEIDHPREGIKTVYIHLNKNLVRSGQTVKSGQAIAEAGNTGKSFAPHLHYEIRHRTEKEKIYNPFEFKYHKTYYRKIPDKDMASFQAYTQKAAELLKN